MNDTPLLKASIRHEDTRHDEDIAADG